jgi:hypothetical protein
MLKSAYILRVDGEVIASDESIERILKVAQGLNKQYSVSKKIVEVD